MTHFPWFFTTLPCHVIVRHIELAAGVWRGWEAQGELEVVDVTGADLCGMPGQTPPRVAWHQFGNTRDELNPSSQH